MRSAATAVEYHRNSNRDHLTGLDRHGYSQQSGPYPTSFSGPPGSVAGGNDVHARDSTGGFLLHPGDSSSNSVARALAGSGSNMGSATSPPPAPPLSSRSREGYPDVAVARQCEREGCNVQPSYGKVWKKVSCEIRYPHILSLSLVVAKRKEANLSLAWFTACVRRFVHLSRHQTGGASVIVSQRRRGRESGHANHLYPSARFESQR